MELEYQETKLCKCVYMMEEEGKGGREGRKWNGKEREKRGEGERRRKRRV